MSLLLRVCLLLVLLCPGAAWAAALCTITTSSGPAFGSYDSLGANASTPRDATGTMSVQCNGAADDLSVEFDQGMYAATGSTCALPLRQMGQGTNRLRYDLYRDAARSLVWGCNPATSSHLVLGSGSPNSVFTIYGRVPPGQVNAAPGLYADTVGVTVTF